MHNSKKKPKAPEIPRSASIPSAQSEFFVTLGPITWEMNTSPSLSEVPPHRRRQRQRMTETELYYRQSVIALIALGLLLLVVLTVFVFVSPAAGGVALTAATPFGIAFFKTLPQLGRKR